MGGHDAGVSLGPVLELPAFPRAAVVGPFATRVRGSTTEVQLAPILVIRRVLPLMAFGVPSAGWQEHVVGAQIGGLFGTEPGVVHDREEGNEPWPAGLLGAHGVEERSRLAGVDDASPVHLARDLGRRPIE